MEQQMQAGGIKAKDLVIEHRMLLSETIRLAIIKFQEDTGFYPEVTQVTAPPYGDKGPRCVGVNVQISI